MPTARFSPLKNRHSTAGRGQLSNEPKKRLFLHDYKVHRKPNPDTLDETLPTNYLALGNRNDIMLAAGALIQKLEYSKKITSPYFKKETPWYNAIVAYKGVSNEGMKKANLVWSLYQTGKHPYSPSKNLF